MRRSRSAFRFTPNVIVSDQNGFGATVPRTLGQGIVALTWSVRMIAFLAFWALALALVGWLVVRLAKQRRDR
ncbi:MAG TPA: hypothetical protein VH207_14805 [Chthoniobacterales bacterium]|jgi:hypothetical protein|nr:hypothetical protein [Chthoniobacterales bacterium]